MGEEIWNASIQERQSSRVSAAKEPASKAPGELLSPTGSFERNRQARLDARLSRHPQFNNGPQTSAIVAARSTHTGPEPTPNQLPHGPSGHGFLSETASSGIEKMYHFAPQMDDLDGRTARKRQLCEVQSQSDASESDHSLQVFYGPRRPPGHTLPQPEDLLRKVMERRHPERIKLAPVDMSCCFSVSDYRQFDMPLVYCSPEFERVSGYTMAEVLGVNHRFMQAPAGMVGAGSVRDHTDNLAVLQMLSKLSLGEEVQVSLMNYKKGGRRWINSLTMIPVSWDGDDAAYIVGLQIDIMEHPESVLQKMPDSTYYIDYRRVQQVPRSPSNRHVEETLELVSGAGSLQQMQNLLNLDDRIEDQYLLNDAWQQFIVDKMPNLIMVCTLKGALSFCSPEVTRVLGYSSEELMSMGLQDFCHASDIVPIMREIREAELGTAIPLLARLRTASLQYIWVDMQGTVFHETTRSQGGTKAVLLTGHRVCSRPLTQSQCLRELQSTQDQQLWCRVDAQGLILWASSALSSFMGVAHDVLIGKNFVLLSSPTDVVALKAGLTSAFAGRETALRHSYAAQMTVGSNPVALSSCFFASWTDEAGHQSIFISTRVLTDDNESMRVTASPFAIAATLQSTQAQRDAASSQQPHTSHQRCFLEELEPERNTSWQYELHQVLLTNRRLKKAIGDLVNVKPSSPSSAKSSETICTNCFKRQTTQWRRGPDGARTLCNACGLHYAKRLNREAAARQETA